MKKLITFFSLLLFTFLSLKLNAQINEKLGPFDLVNLERHQFTFGSGLRYEIGIFKNVSASTSLAPAFGSYSEGYTLGLAWNIRMRYYHNIQKRLDINNNVTGNSANYIGPARSAFPNFLQIANNFNAPSGFNVEFFGGVYGIQRSYRSGFNFNAELGIGYYRGDGVLSGYGGLFSFTFGWLATKPKKNKPKINWQN